MGRLISSRQRSMLTPMVRHVSFKSSQCLPDDLAGTRGAREGETVLNQYFLATHTKLHDLIFRIIAAEGLGTVLGPHFTPDSVTLYAVLRATPPSRVLIFPQT